MVKINTNLGVSVNLENAPTPKPIMNVGEEKIVGKDKFGALADTLAQINPTIKKLADKDLKQKAEASFEEGQATINGMTLEQAKEAHKNGFPDIFNGWARYGAYKQYANNSVDNFIQDFKNDYWSKRNQEGYNWQEHYNEASATYLQGKEGDEFFASAYNNGTEEIRKWLNVKEFEKQQEELQFKVTGNTSLAIQNLPEKVEEQLEILFYDQELLNDPEGMNVNGYQERKAKFFQDNMSKTFIDMFYKLKTDKNPALSNADFDDIVISEAETHAKLDGRFAPEYIQLLTQDRPDGTPAIINNPKHQKRVIALVDELKDSINLNRNTAMWWNGSLASTGMKKSDRIEVGEQAFAKEIKRLISTGEATSEADAFLKATLTFAPAMAKNEPIPQIVDLFEKPLSSQYTEDAKLAIEVYKGLEQNGMVGIYFEENDKNRYKFFIASILSDAGVDPRDIVRQVGTMDMSTSTITELSSANKKTLQGFAGNMAYAPNLDLVYTVAEYFKNINSDVNDNFISQTKKFIDEYYENINGRYVSKYKLNQFGVTKDNYDAFKVASIEILKEKLNGEKSIIQDTDIVGFFYDETNPDITGQAPNATNNQSIDLNNYELIVNREGDTLYFKDDNSFMTDVPATVEYKDGRTVWLEVPIQLVKERVTKKNEELIAKADKARAKKDKELRIKREKNQEFLSTQEGMTP